MSKFKHGDKVLVINFRYNNCLPNTVYEVVGKDNEVSNLIRVSGPTSNNVKTQLVFESQVIIAKSEILKEILSEEV